MRGKHRPIRQCLESTDTEGRQPPRRRGSPVAKGSIVDLVSRAMVLDPIGAPRTLVS